MPYTQVRAFLNDEASVVWDEVTMSRRFPYFSYGEVGVTERLHLHLLMVGPSGFAGLRWYQPDEPTTGADWEWVIADPTDATRFLWYRVQAKILAKPPARTLRFTEINHRGGVQRTRLLAGPRTMYPFYCFYIGDPWPATQPMSYPAGVVTRHRQRQHGATAVPALVVDHVYRAARTKTAAVQYLTAGAGADLRLGRGRRLSDLFPGRPGGGPGGPGGGGPDGPGGGGPDGERVRDDAQNGAVEPPESDTDLSLLASQGADVAWTSIDALPDDYQEDIERIRAPGVTTPVVVNDRPGRDDSPRVTAYFLGVDGLG